VGKMIQEQREECDRQREETGKVIHLIERTELVSGGGSCNGLYSS
jgi:hypothetical protein